MKTNYKLYLGDSAEVLKGCPDNYFDSVVTDPPYGLSFMGKKWDYDVPTVEIWKECLRVLKPGGHLLAFGGTRTYHRLVVAIEDAGFEIRDQIQWIYGQGFPKSQDISKMIDKAAGAEREVLATMPAGSGPLKTGHVNSSGGGMSIGTERSPEIKITAPATPEAKQWTGWGTALKPANEPICLARKPLSESTIAKNVLKHGTGGLNIDGARIKTDEVLGRLNHTPSTFNHKNTTPFVDNSGGLGRFPSNVILDDDAAKVLDEQTGELKSGAWNGVTNKARDAKAKGAEAERVREDRPADSGGASRFFYVAKASKSDRGADNTHPTVKPTKLMEYLIKLVTPPGGKVLDPFMGSGTTGVAALRNGFEFRGIELEEVYLQIAKRRIEGSLNENQV
jgi:site-specific DNA-methyltransferase (adenine-specific)